MLQNAVDVTKVFWLLAKDSHTIRREDLAQLSPYITLVHVKRFGNYAIDLDAASTPLDSEMP